MNDDDDDDDDEWLTVAVSRQREEPELRRRDDTQLRQGRAAQGVSRDHGSRDRSQHRLTGRSGLGCTHVVVS